VGIFLVTEFGGDESITAALPFEYIAPVRTKTFQPFGVKRYWYFFG
jgi:hypothetical protein